MASEVDVFLSATDYLDRAYELATKDGELGPLERSLYVKYSRYILSIRKALPVSTLIVAQSPYNRDIFPEAASAMSYNGQLTAGTFQEIPATVEVLANDISRTCNCDFLIPMEWFRDSWMYVKNGVLVINTRSVTESGSHEAEREAARLLSLMKVVIEASAARGGGPVSVYTMGNPAKDFGDKLRSCVDTTMVTVTVKSSPHPAYISRRHSDLRSPECTLGRPSFCRGLYAVIMASRKAQEAAKERERELLVKDLNSFNTNGRKVANSYGEYVAMLESDSSSDVIPKTVAIQMLTTLRDSLISVCEASRSIATFIKIAGSGGGGDIGQLVASGTTRPPNMDSRVPPGDVRSMSSPSRAPSVATDTSRRLTPAEIRKRRQRAAAPATPGGDTESLAETASNAPPATPTPAKPTSARAQRMASRAKPTATPTSTSTRLSEMEAGSMTIMAEYLSSNSEDPEAGTWAEQIMACIDRREAKSGIAFDALKAVRADAAKDSNYDASKYLGLGDEASIFTSNTYQFCSQYPSWTFKP